MRNRDFLTHHRILFRCRSGTGRSAGTQFVRLFHQMPHTLAVDQLEQQFSGLLTGIDHVTAHGGQIRIGRGAEGEFHVKHFLYSRNGCGTDDHPRIPEDEQMAAELTAYLASFGPDLWQ